MLRAHTSTRLLDGAGEQNQGDERLSVAAIFFIVLAAVALFVVGMLYVCSYIRSSHRKNNDQVRTKNVVIELPDEAPTADDETATLGPIDLVSCESECSVVEKDVHVLDPESALPDPSDIGRQHAALDVHYCTSACCEACRQDVVYPDFVSVDQTSNASQEDNKLLDVAVSEGEESTKPDPEIGANLATGSNDKGTGGIDDLAVNGKEEPGDSVSKRDSVNSRYSDSGSNGEVDDISQSQISPPKGSVRISVTNSDSADSEENSK